MAVKVLDAGGKMVEFGWCDRRIPLASRKRASMREAVRQALIQFEDACSGSGHQMCQGHRFCEDALAVVGRWRQEQWAAAGFDVGRAVLERQGGMPEHDWATSTLLAFAIDRLKSQPNLDALRRATAITTAFARLGERGLPVDSMVRTCIGPEYLRHIIIVVANVWCDIEEGRASRRDVPELEGWLQAVDDELASAGNCSIDRGWVTMRALQGVPRARGEVWLREAAVTHVLAWRLDDYAQTVVDAEDLVLPCGDAGTRWVYERFTKTYPEEWSPPSLVWEAAFRADPDLVARQTSIETRILAERLVTEEQLTRAFLGSVASQSISTMVDGLSIEELTEVALIQLEEGFLEGARQLAEKASRQIPQDGHLRMLRAFCHVPIEPAASRTVWQRMLDAGNLDGKQAPILRADIASSFLMERRLDLAIAEVSRISVVGDEVSAWLWDPTSLPSSPRVRHTTLATWLQEFRAATS